MDNSIVLQKIYEALPEYKDVLLLNKITYSKTHNRALFYFTSSILVVEKEYLKIENILRELFPKIYLSIRVSSKNLAEDFKKDIGKYRPVLEDYISRHCAPSKGFLETLDWKMINDERIAITCGSPVFKNILDESNISNGVKNAINDIFGLEYEVEIIVGTEREKWINDYFEKIKTDIVEEKQILIDTNSNNIKVSKEQENEKKKTVNKNEEKKDGYKTKFTKKIYIEGQSVLLGNKIDGESIKIEDCTVETSNIVLDGIVSNITVFDKGRVILTFVLSDDTSSIYCKAFLRADSKLNEEKGSHSLEELVEFASSIKENERLLVKGSCTYDTYLNDPCIILNSISKMPQTKIVDTAEEKRVELNLHTQMSTLEATNSAADMISYAASLGHKAIAITDYGVVQSYPEAFSSAKKNNIKLIPGCEIFMCDYDVPIVDPDTRSIKESIVVLDFETTGLNTKKDIIIEIGAVKLVNGEIRSTFSTLVNPGKPLDPVITKITGISDDMLISAPNPNKATKDLLSFIGDSVIAAHNASFDTGILYSQLERMGLSINTPVLDTLALARAMYPELKSYRLKSLCNFLHVTLSNAHRAVHDATATAQALNIMLNELSLQSVNTLVDINKFLENKSLGRAKNITVLVQKQCGLENLYYLVTQGHLKYFKRSMRVPRDEVSSHREGLLIGSCTSEGELYQAILNAESDEVVEKIASYYDYLEIQPIEHNLQLLDDGLVDGIEDLQNINIRIVKLGEKLNIPVVATGNVHFKFKNDSIYRAMIHATVGKKNFDKQAPLYFMHTNDMLNAHKYLGNAKSYEVVVENTNDIADSIEQIRQYPKHPDGESAVTFQPFWKNAAKNIERCTYYNAKRIYGENLPDVVQKRIDKELKSILGYGFGTLYNIAQKLVMKSNKDGYLVGSRGSVGSSFVATMCGITEVNPLPPHYICTHCHEAHFDIPEGISIGVDLPDRECPKCKAQMRKDGYDIPFEVFLGFEGDKVPDIDLNFSGEYQGKAHAYVEELFGKGYVFRAGTISALKDKTAFGYVNKYEEETGKKFSRAYKDRLVSGLAGVKRTTGQHPGGMVVLPNNYSIYQFTPLQHPADDFNADTITTHFDFNSMHDILVKLDILGHDDPTMLHDLEELTGVSYKNIPLDDKNVMSLFSSTKALNVSEDDILSKTGTLGVPEFGTDFVQGMLMETLPTTMSELLRISGLSHGTDVWLGNARDLILDKTATLSECVCTRDDIMNALIAYGLESKMSFDTMEAVRKGKGLKPQVEEEMRKHNVPEWFISSCNKIKYMFPKAHAAAYVIMALRIAYYKVYYPLDYYAAYFSIRSKGYNGETMILDTNILRGKVKYMMENSNNLGVKEKDELYAMRMALEMQSRGFGFLHADIYKSDATKFLKEGNNLRIPLNSLPGLGDTVAESIVYAREKEFNSIEDLKKRAKIGNSIIELLKKNNAISNMQETAQGNMLDLLMI